LANDTFLSFNRAADSERCRSGFRDDADHYSVLIPIRILCDIEVQDAPTIVADDEKAIGRAEGDRRNSEEVHRGNRSQVITEKEDL
jgi:hypothetical protein